MNIKHRFKILIGTGGIGSGIFFELKGNRTLGRNESRLGTLLNRQDFCKLHIISHYVSIILNRSQQNRFEVLPIGKVGVDPIGNKLLKQMKEAGIDISHIKKVKDVSTLFSVCFQYPDSSGGNITTDNSASNLVSVSDIECAEDYFKKFSNSGIALAVPEVPLEPRVKIIELGTKYNFFRVFGFNSLEAKELFKQDIFTHIDLLAMNIDEAEAVLNCKYSSLKSTVFLNRICNRLVTSNPRMKISLTMGSKGSYGYDGRWEQYPCISVKPVSTAGAGDAYLAGLIIAIIIGLPFIPRKHIQKCYINSAMEFANLLASFSVTSPDTINLKATPVSLYKFGLEKGKQLSGNLKKSLNITEADL